MEIIIVFNNEILTFNQIVLFFFKINQDSGNLTSSLYFLKGYNLFTVI